MVQGDKSRVQCQVSQRSHQDVLTVVVLECSRVLLPDMLLSFLLGLCGVVSWYIFSVLQEFNLRINAFDHRADYLLVSSKLSIGLQGVLVIPSKATQSERI